MTMIQLEVSEEHADMLVEQMQDEVKRIENTLNSFRSNNLTHTEAYQKLGAEKDDLKAGIEQVQDQIDEQKDSELGNLFG